MSPDGLEDITVMVLYYQRQPEDPGEQEISWGSMERAKILVHVCMHLRTSVNHCLTWAWKITEGFKIATAARKIHYL